MGKIGLLGNLGAFLLYFSVYSVFLYTLLYVSLISLRENFHYVNNEFVDSLILEAVELDDLESIEAILAWRNIKASEMGITEVDRRLLRMQKNAQEVIICAAIKNNYSIVKILHSDGYKIFDKMADDRFFFCNGSSDQAEYCMDAGRIHLNIFTFQPFLKTFLLFSCKFIFCFFSETLKKKSPRFLWKKF